MTDTEKQPIIEQPIIEQPINIEQQIGIKSTPMEKKSTPKKPTGVLFILGLLMGIILILISFWGLSEIWKTFSTYPMYLDNDIFSIITSFSLAIYFWAPLVMGLGIIFISLGGFFSIKKKSEL